jgi:YhcH/YjgK/YiaL family protein
MIHDLLTHSATYEKLHPDFPKAFAWLRAFDPSTPDGKYEIDGPGLTAGVQRYETKPDAEKKWEAHEVHGDIQVVFAGEEICGHTDVRALTVTEPYQAAKDVAKYAHPAGPTSRLHLRPGFFTVFLPQDGHQPGVQAGKPTTVLKVVIKFRA